jgi:hypothetical protein
MAPRRLTFIFFATAILFSMVREWSAPVACVRNVLVASTMTRTHR